MEVLVYVKKGISWKITDVDHVINYVVLVIKINAAPVLKMPLYLKILVSVILIIKNQQKSAN